MVDNGQRGGEPLTELLPADVRILPMPENRGYTGGANAALQDWARRHPDANMCLIGSHDLHAAPDALAELVGVAASRPEAGIVAPTITKPHLVAGGRWDGRRGVQVRAGAADGDVVERDWASGTCLLLRQSCVTEVGPFDERLGSYVEDVDYGLRVRDCGWRVLVVRTARVHGLGSSATDAHRRITSNTVLLSAKRRGWRGAWSTFAFFLGLAAKGYLASLRPWRQPEDRARSRALARQRTAGLCELLASGRLRHLLREEGWTWR